MHIASICLAIISTALLSSCGLQERIYASYSQPKHLDSNPEATGLLVVDVHLKHKGSMSPLGLETSVSVSEGIIRQADARVPIRQGSLREKLVLYQLAPGTYELVSVVGYLKGGTPQQPFYHTVEPFLVSEAGPITVAPGQIAYVGKLTAIGHSKMGRPGFSYSYEWDRDRAREAEALNIIEQHYPDSPWTLLLRKRLDSLRQSP